MPTQITVPAAGKPLDGRPVLDPVTCSLAGGERTEVIGENGSGKGTLLRVLAGELAPDSGHVTRRGRIGCLPQEPHPGGPDETLPVAFARGRAGEAAQHTDRLLSLGLFDRDRLTGPVDRLSTGQRQRLALARMVSEPSDVLLLDEPVLLLDEPANHLSPALVEDMEAALAGYDGTIVIVSHDRRLRRRRRGTHLAMRAAPASAAGS
ncbi:ATP-binding cassette domain-containing protein [Streptosporangium canum]|uniref:ATP-binding cassette domain-containing protein n=1 Tax=Streptosporangium canum TaxID=324952 RepID=UPI0034376460